MFGLTSERELSIRGNLCVCVCVYEFAARIREFGMCTVLFVIYKYFRVFVRFCFVLFLANHVSSWIYSKPIGSCLQNVGVCVLPIDMTRNIEIAVLALIVAGCGCWASRQVR